VPPRALILVLASCLLHAWWNLIAKRCREPAAAFWWAMAVSALAYLPATVLFLLTSQWPAVVWLYLLGTGLCIGLYQMSLGLAYGHGDLSLVYPVARTSPIFIQIWAAILLGEAMTLPGTVAIVMVVTGAAGLTWQRGAGGIDRAGPPLKAIGWAAAAAIANSFSHIFDRAAMKHLSQQMDLAHVAYLHMEFTLTWLTMTIAYAPWNAEKLRSAWREARSACVAVGLLEPAAYLLILLALSIPQAKVAYVAGLRQAGILLGVILGWRILRERQALARLPAVVVMVAGLGLLAMGK